MFTRCRLPFWKPEGWLSEIRELSKYINHFPNQSCEMVNLVWYHNMIHVMRLVENQCEPFLASTFPLNEFRVNFISTAITPLVINDRYGNLSCSCSNFDKMTSAIEYQLGISKLLLKRERSKTSSTWWFKSSWSLPKHCISENVRILFMYIASHSHTCYV